MRGLFVSRERVLCSPGWPQTCCGAEADLGFMVVLPLLLSSRITDVHPHNLASAESKGLGMPGKFSSKLRTKHTGSEYPVSI